MVKGIDNAFDHMDFCLVRNMTTTELYCKRIVLGIQPLLPGPGCSKLTTLLVNVSLKFQTLISSICQYFLLKKCEKLLSFFQQKISVYLEIKS